MIWGNDEISIYTKELIGRFSTFKDELEERLRVGYGVKPTLDLSGLNLSRLSALAA